jgi:hypothetical protein
MAEFGMDAGLRLPLQSRMRIEAWDAKLLAGEDAKATWDGLLKQGCKCNVYICSTREEDLMHMTIKTHFAIYGRYPFHRGHTKVVFNFHIFVFSTFALAIVLLSGRINVDVTWTKWYLTWCWRNPNLDFRNENNGRSSTMSCSIVFWSFLQFIHRSCKGMLDRSQASVATLPIRVFSSYGWLFGLRDKMHKPYVFLHNYVAGSQICFVTCQTN